MKEKKNRKSVRAHTSRSCSRRKDTAKLFQVKFDVLRNDISCFINNSRSSKQPSRKASNIVSINQKQISLKNIESKQTKKAEHSTNNLKKRNESPDLIRQCSNTILNKIEEQGLKCGWPDPKQDQAQDKNTQNKEDEIQNECIWNAFNSSFQKSFASTTDNQIIFNQCQQWQLIKEPYVTFSQNPFAIETGYICRDWRTTIMIKNIPNKYNVNELAAQIDSEHADSYDFLYLPCDPKNLCNVGYGFINFVSTQQLRSFYQKFNQYVWKKYRSQKICSLAYARLQGLNQLIQHFSNSKVLNQKQKKYRPIIKYKQIQKMVLQQQRR